MLHLYTHNRMTDTVFPIVNWVAIAANLTLGIITLHDINLVAAAVGALMAMLANLDKVAISLARVYSLYKNNWQVPVEQKKEQHDESN